MCLNITQNLRACVHQVCGCPVDFALCSQKVVMLCRAAVPPSAGVLLLRPLTELARVRRAPLLPAGGIGLSTQAIDQSVAHCVSIRCMATCDAGYPGRPLLARPKNSAQCEEAIAMIIARNSAYRSLDRISLYLSG